MFFCWRRRALTEADDEADAAGAAAEAGAVGRDRCWGRRREPCTRLGRRQGGSQGQRRRRLRKRPASGLHAVFVFVCCVLRFKSALPPSPSPSFSKRFAGNDNGRRRRGSVDDDSISSDVKSSKYLLVSRHIGGQSNTIESI